MVSGATLCFEGVLEEEFLPDSVFLMFAILEGAGCEVGGGLLSRSGGNGDRSGGIFRGFSGVGLFCFLISVGFEVRAAFLDWGEAQDVDGCEL